MSNGDAGDFPLSFDEVLALFFMLMGFSDLDFCLLLFKFDAACGWSKRGRGIGDACSLGDFLKENNIIVDYNKILIRTM